MSLLVYFTLTVLEVITELIVNAIIFIPYGALWWILPAPRWISFDFKGEK